MISKKSKKIWYGKDEDDTGIFMNEWKFKLFDHKANSESTNDVEHDVMKVDK